MFNGTRNHFRQGRGRIDRCRIPQINLDYPFISDLPLLSGSAVLAAFTEAVERIGAGLLEQDLARTPSHVTGDRHQLFAGHPGRRGSPGRHGEGPGVRRQRRQVPLVLVGIPIGPTAGSCRVHVVGEAQGIGDLFPFGPPGSVRQSVSTTYYQNQYDGFADFPAYFSLLSVTNALVGILFEHVVPGYVFDDPTRSNVVSTTVGNTTYVTIPHLLPLLAPLRLAASLVGAQRWSIRWIRSCGSSSRWATTRAADPSPVERFAWSIPEVREAHDALPAAFAQSMAILGGAIYTPTVPVGGRLRTARDTRDRTQPFRWTTRPRRRRSHDTVSEVASVLGAGSQNGGLGAAHDPGGKEPELSRRARPIRSHGRRWTSVGQRDVAATRSQNRTAQPADEPEPEATTEPEATGGTSRRTPNRPRNPRRPATSRRTPVDQGPQADNGPETKSDDRVPPRRGPSRL